MTTKAVAGICAVALGAAAVWVAPQLLAERGSEAHLQSAPRSAAQALLDPLQPAEAAPPEDLRAPLTEAPRLQAPRGDEPRSTAIEDSREAWVEVFVGKARSGAALGNARVEAMRTDEEFRRTNRPDASGRTDAGGVVRLRVPLGAPVRLTVNPGEDDEPVRGGGRVLEAFEPDETRQVKVWLEHGIEGRFYAQVVDDSTGAILPGAVFVRHRTLAPGVDVFEHIASAEPEAIDQYTLGTVDAGGSFVARFPTWDPSTLVVHHPGYQPLRVEVGRREQSPAAPFLVRLKRLGLVTVQVRTAFGAADEHAVRFLGGGYESALVSLGPDGTAEFTGLPPEVELTGEVHYAGRLVWLTPEPVVIEAGETRSLSWSVGSGARVHGVARDEAGRPVIEHEILVLPAEAEDLERYGRRLLDDDDRGRAIARAMTDARGRFELGEIAAGAWWIGLAATDARGPEAPAPLALGVRIEPGELERRVDLQTNRGLYITGSLTGPGQAPFQYASIHASPRGAVGRANARAERDGSFQVGPLLAGTNRLWFGGSGFMTRGSYGVEAGESIELSLGEENAIGGRVLDPAGGTLAAHVHLILPSGSLGMGTTGKALGAFLFADLSPGTYALKATTPDGRVALLGGIALEQGEAHTDLELELEPGGSIRIEFEGPTGFRTAIYSRGFKVGDSSLRGTSFVVVPAGDTRVEVYGRNARGEEVRRVQHVQAIAGQVQEVRFEVEE